jgi:hypothetical protein
LRIGEVSYDLGLSPGADRTITAERRQNFFMAKILAPLAGGLHESVFECVPLLELCKREKLITDEAWAELKAELEVLSKMLAALIKGTDRSDR